MGMIIKILIHYRLVMKSKNDDIRVEPIPYTLYPTPFPRDAFKQACNLSVLFNTLIDRVSRDYEFISQQLKR